MNDIQDQIDELTGTSPAVAQQEADNIAASTPDTNATTHLYGMGLEKQDAPILQEEASGEGRGIDMSPDAMGTVTGTAIPDNTYNTSYVTDSDGKHLLFDPNTYDAMPWPELNIKEKDALAQMAQAYFAVGANREPENYIGYTPLARDGSLSWWSHLVGGTQKMLMNVIPSTAKAISGAGLVSTYTLANILANPFQLISNSGSALANTGFGRWAKGVADKLEDTQVAVEQMADVVDKTLDPIERTVLATYDADMSDTSMKAELGRGMGSALGMVLTARGLMGLNIGVNAPALTASIFGLSEVNELRHKALDAGVSPEWARAYATGGAGVVIATDVAEIMGGMGMLTLTYKAGKDIVKSWKNRGLLHYLKKEGLDVLAEAGLEDVQETVEGWYDPDFQENPIDRLFVAGVSAGALRLLGVPASIRHAKLADQMALAEAAGVGPQYASALGILNSTIDEMIEKGAIDESQRMGILRAAISEAPDAIIEELRLAQKGGIQAIPEETRRNFAQTLKAIQSNFQGDVFSSQTMRQLDSETDLALAGIRNGLSDAEVSMIKGIVRGAYVVAAVANANNPKYKGFTIPKFIVAKNAEGYSYYDRNKNEIGIHEGRSNTEYTNISPDYARRLDSNFVPASRQSDKMASILHEMSHWMDAMVGEKGFGDFLEHYYNNIALAFGKEKARELYTDREGKGKSKGRPSEYFAQTIARLGKRSAEAFGLGKSEANRFLSYANIVMNQLGALKGKDGEALRQSIVDFQDALQRVTKANMGHLADIIDAYGTDNIKRALRNFNKDSEGFNDFAEYLANKDMLSELFDVMDSFSDATGMQKINDLFDGDQDAMENFVTMGDKMFREGYDKAVEEVRQRRVEAKKTAPKPVEAKSDLDLVRTAIGIVGSTTDSSQVHEDGVEHEVGSYTYTLGDGTEVAYDNNDGIGATGTNRYAQEGDWKSAIITMTPDEYLTLSPSMENTPDSVPFIKESIKNGKTIAMPFLLASGHDVEESAPNTLIVNQHEGRHRAQALKELGVTSMDVVVYGSALQDPKYANGLKGVTLQYSDSNRTVTVTDVLTEPYSRGQINNSMGTGNKEFEKGGIQYETQDWAKAALAKDSVKESFEAGKQEKKQIAADTKIDGRDLTDDINMANQGLTQRLKQPMNKFVKWASSSSWGWGLDRILVTILGRDVAEKLDIAGKYSAKQNIRSRYWDEFMARLKPLFGDPKTNTEFMFKYKTMVTNLGFARMTGVEMIDPANPAITSTRDITGWEAMYVYLMKEQGFGDRIQRSTTTNIDDIIATLSEDEKAFALHMSDQLMSMYEKAFGKSKYAHYFPILDAEHELFDELSIDSLMARQNTDDAIAITDAGRIFSQYVSRWASHESNYFQTMKRTRDIFRYTGVDKNEMGPMYTFDLEQDNARKRASAQVAAEVRQVIGEDGYRNLMNLIESELQDGQEQMFDASRNKTLTQMGNNIIKSILANKMMSFPKNIANVFMFWGGAQDQSRYWNSFAEGLGNFKDTFDYMMKHSPEIKQRWGAAGGINEYLDQRTLGGSTAPVMKGVSKAFAKMDWTGDKTQNMAKFSAVMDMMGDAGLKLFMQSGDMIANVYGGYGLVKDFMAQGMSEAEAFRKLDRYIIEHQSSSNLAMKPLVQKLQNKSLMGQVFAFTSEGVAKWASILGTFDEVKMGTATKSEALANVVSIAISMTLYSLLAAGAWDLLDDDEKVQEETVKALGNTLLDQVFGGMVAGNAFITPAISYLVGDSRVSGMSVPIYNFALDGISALKKGEYDRVITKAMSALGMPVGADNLWNTYLGMSLLNDPNPDVRYAGRLMLAGFTPSRSAKRAGIKKEVLEKNDEE